MGSDNSSAAKKLRKEAANKRNFLKQGRSIQKQLGILDRRLGFGVGAKKERARLLALQAEHVYAEQHPNAKPKPKPSSV